MGATFSTRRGRPTATFRRFAAEVFDEKMKAKGIVTEQAKAELLDVHRATLNRWRNPDFLFRPALDDARYYAANADIPVDELFVSVHVDSVAVAVAA